MDKTLHCVPINELINLGVSFTEGLPEYMTNDLVEIEKIYREIALRHCVRGGLFDDILQMLCEAYRRGYNRGLEKGVEMEKEFVRTELAPKIAEKIQKEMSNRLRRYL